MSKSLKNFVSVRDFLGDHTPELFRMFCFQHKYRANVTYGPGNVEVGSAAVYGAHPRPLALWALTGPFLNSCCCAQIAWHKLRLFWTGCVVRGTLRTPAPRRGRSDGATLTLPFPGTLPPPWTRYAGMAPQLLASTVLCLVVQHDWRLLCKTRRAAERRLVDLRRAMAGKHVCEGTGHACWCCLCFCGE